MLEEKVKMVVVKEICIIICIGTLVSVWGQINLSSSLPHIPFNEGAAFSKQTIGLGSPMSAGSRGSSLSFASRRSSANSVTSDVSMRNRGASIIAQSNNPLMQNSATSIRSLSNFAPPQNIPLFRTN